MSAVGAERLLPRYSIASFIHVALFFLLVGDFIGTVCYIIVLTVLIAPGSLEGWLFIPILVMVPIYFIGLFYAGVPAMIAGIVIRALSPNVSTKPTLLFLSPAIGYVASLLFNVPIEAINPKFTALAYVDSFSQLALIGAVASFGSTFFGFKRGLLPLKSTDTFSDEARL